MTLIPPEPSTGSAGSGECVDVDTLLAFMQGELDADTRDAVELHIDGCQDCQALQSEASMGAASTLASVVPGPGALPEAVDVVGRYRVERFVASGGMGDIYGVHDLVLDESIALKTITAAAVNDAKAILRLKAEVKLARRVCNPHTCRIFDYGEHEHRGGSIQFLTMEFIEGESLGHRLRKQGKLAPAAIAVVARQLLEGLLAAHAVGVLHRDFKSDNVMLRARGDAQDAPHAVIMDFGLARALHEEGDRLTSHTQALLGSAAYMAPEQVEGSELTEGADVYAFGVVLFEMLTGTLPFRASTPLATALLRLRCSPQRPSQLVPELDPLWDEVVMGCLHRQAAKRMSCEQALELLARIAKTPGRHRPRRMLRYGSRSSAFGWGVACTLTWGVLGAAAWPRAGRSSLREEVHPIQAAQPSPPAASGVPSGGSGAPTAAAVHQGTPDDSAWMLDAAQALAAQWRLTHNERACRQASALFSRALGQSSGPSESVESAEHGLRELGNCLQKTSTKPPRDRTTLPKGAPPSLEPPPVQRTLPSDDPVDGLFGPGSSKPP